MNKATNDLNDRLSGSTIFISASIPDRERWKGNFDPLGITDAVVAVARTVLQNGGKLVTAAHPTIAPLLLYVATEQLEENDQRIIVYQSRAFKDVLPVATKRYQDEGIGKIKWTARIDKEPPDPKRAPKSLKKMRYQMLKESKPVAAVFIGGMEGISDEYNLFHKLYPASPVYAFKQPGGEARKIVDKLPDKLESELAESDIYSTVARYVVDDIASKASKSSKPSNIIKARRAPKSVKSTRVSKSVKSAKPSVASKSVKSTRVSKSSKLSNTFETRRASKIIGAIKAPKSASQSKGAAMGAD